MQVDWTAPESVDRYLRNGRWNVSETEIKMDEYVTEHQEQVRGHPTSCGIKDHGTDASGGRRRQNGKQGRRTHTLLRASWTSRYSGPWRPTILDDTEVYSHSYRPEVHQAVGSATQLLYVQASGQSRDRDTCRLISPLRSPHSIQHPRTKGKYANEVMDTEPRTECQTRER